MIKKLLLAMVTMFTIASCSTSHSIGSAERIRNDLGEGFVLEGIDNNGCEWYWNTEYEAQEINCISEDGAAVEYIMYFTSGEMSRGIYEFLADSNYQCTNNYCIGKYDMFIFLNEVIFNEDMSIIVQQPLMRREYFKFDND